MQNLNATVVMAQGILTFDDVKQIARTIATLDAQEQRRIVVDWLDVQWINPLAIGLLLARRHALVNQSGELKFSRMRREVRDLFCKYQLDELFENYATLEDAIQSFDEEWASDGETIVH